MKSPFDGLSDLDLLTLCLYGEARGEGLDGMLAVASVVVNRASAGGRYGAGIKDVVLRPRQFSCFNPEDPNYATLARVASDMEGSLKHLSFLRTCRWIAKGLIEGELQGNVGNATHYHSTAVKPDWAGKLTKIRQIGRHIFYA